MSGQRAKGEGRSFASRVLENMGERIEGEFCCQSESCGVFKNRFVDLRSGRRCLDADARLRVTAVYDYLVLIVLDDSCCSMDLLSGDAYLWTLSECYDSDNDSDTEIDTKIMPSAQTRT